MFVSLVFHANKKATVSDAIFILSMVLFFVASTLNFASLDSRTLPLGVFGRSEPKGSEGYSEFCFLLSTAKGTSPETACQVHFADYFVGAVSW